MDRPDDEDSSVVLARACGVTHRRPAANPPSNVLPLRTPVRTAARPRWVFPKGAFSDPDINAVPQAVPVPGVDPKDYDVGEIMADMQYVVGSSTMLSSAPSRSAVHEAVERAIADYENLIFSLADTLGRRPYASNKNARSAIPTRAAVSARPTYALDQSIPLFDDLDFLVGRHETDNVVYHVWMRGFDFTHGNEHFFKPDDTARVRLRPLVRTDWINPRRALRTSTGWFGGDVNTLLWVDRPEGGATAFLVHLFPRGDCEDPKTIARAIGEAWHQYGADFPAALALLT